MSMKQTRQRLRGGHVRDNPSTQRAVPARPPSRAQAESDGQPSFFDVKTVVSALPPVNGNDLAEVGCCYVSALRRVLAKTPSPIIVASVLSTPTVAAAIGLTAIYQIDELNHGHTPLAAAFIVAIAYSAILGALGIFTVAMIRRWARSGYVYEAAFRASRDNAVRRMTIAAAIASVAPLVTLLLRIPTSHMSVGYLTYGPLIFNGMITTEALMALGYGLPHPGRPSPLQPLDRVGTRLVAVIAALHACASEVNTVTRSNVRSLISELEMLAREAERFGTPRVPWWDRATRRRVLLDGLRLATVIRAHKRKVMTAMSAEDFEAVARSLAGGAVAWARNDLPTMLRDAPDLTLPRTLSTLIIRIGPAAVLVASSIILPLLPPLNKTAQATINFRVALLIAAVLSLTTSAAQLPDYMRTVVEKTILPK